MKSLTAQFLDWVRAKPVDDAYDFYNDTQCAFAQFERDIGCYSGPRDALSGGINAMLPALTIYPLAETPHTFGLLADRLAAALEHSNADR